MAPVPGWPIRILDRTLRRLDPSLPLVSGWPGIRRLASGAYWRILRPTYERGVIWLAVRRRRRLRSTAFIGVTGSAGKTTTKILIGAILSTRGRGRTTSGNYNLPHHVAQTVLRTSSRDAFCVLELGVAGPGFLDRHLAIAQPTLGVVTNVGTDHLSIGSIKGVCSRPERCSLT